MVCVPCQGKNQYRHITDLMTLVIEKRLEEAAGFLKRQDLEEGDERRLAKTLAPVPPPSSSKLAQQQKSRF